MDVLVVMASFDQDRMFCAAGRYALFFLSVPFFPSPMRSLRLSVFWKALGV
jgi:hypothetical protein